MKGRREAPQGPEKVLTDPRRLGGTQVPETPGSLSQGSGALGGRGVSPLCSPVRAE